MNYSDIIYNLLGFTVVAIIFLIILSITLKVLSKRFSIEKIKLYGVFLNMNNNAILSFSLISINYLFLVWCLINFQMNYIYAIFSIALIILSDLFSTNFKRMLINFISSLIEIISIYVITIFRDYLTTDGNMALSIILLLVILFIFLYYTYTMFRRLNNIVKLQVPKKKVKDENWEFKKSS